VPCHVAKRTPHDELEPEDESINVSTLAYDAVVVGAGPAGASAAYELARGGARVLLLEKERLPRYKPCGGGVTPRARAVSPLASGVLPGVGEAQTDTILLAHGERTISGRVLAPLVMVMRDRFDAALAAAAVAAGAELRDGTALTGLERAGAGLRLVAGGEAIATRYIIGADGAAGLTARLAGFGSVADRGAPAIEVELAVSAAIQARYATTTLINLAATPGGYGWVFAKGDHLSVGVAGFLPGGRRALRANLDRFLGRYPDLQEGRALLRRGHVIPLVGQRTTRQRGPVVLAGDAAGLADPLTGEGISYALASGHRAGVAVLDALHEMPGALPRYDRFVDRTLGRDLRYARAFAALAYRYPGPLLRVLARSADAQGAAASAIGGALSYRTLLARLATEAPSLLRYPNAADPRR